MHAGYGYVASSAIRNDKAVHMRQILLPMISEVQQSSSYCIIELSTNSMRLAGQASLRLLAGLS